MVRYLLILIFFFTSSIINAQQTPNALNNGFSKERFIFGGNVGAQFGSSTQVNLSPIIGYRITEKLSAGIGVNYLYYKFKYLGYNNQTFTEKNHIYGGNVWAQYLIIPQAFLHAEYGVLNIGIPKLGANGAYNGDTQRYNVNTCLVGGGYYQRISDNAGVQFSILWDLIEDQYSPYNNPIIRIGFAAGF
jgi:long-subunit fatty acid transport protein